MSRLFAKVRKSGPDGMNKTERAYADTLDLLQKAGEVASWKFEAVKLKLAGATFYSPDFLVILPCGRVEMHEVKGFWMDDARVKLKVAAESFPWFIFKAIKKSGRGWDIEEFRP